MSIAINIPAYTQQSGVYPVSGATPTTGSIPGDPFCGCRTWQPATATSGTDTTPANNTQFVSSIFVPANINCNGVEYLIGTVGGTDKAYVVIYDYTGAVVINSSIAGGGATVGTAANTQQLLFTSTQLKGPATYYVGLSINGNTSRIRTVPAFVHGGLHAGSVAQTHGTVATITVPTTFTADKAPICWLTNN